MKSHPDNPSDINPIRMIPLTNIVMAIPTAIPIPTPSPMPNEAEKLNDGRLNASPCGISFFPKWNPLATQDSDYLPQQPFSPYKPTRGHDGPYPVVRTTHKG